MSRSIVSYLGLTLLLAALVACSSSVSPTNPPTGPSNQGKLGKPSNFQVTAVSGGFSLTWNAVQGASGYVLLRTGAGGSVSLGQPSYTEKNVQAGDTVEYSVSAKNSLGVGDALVVTVTMPKSGTVTPPQPAPAPAPAPTPAPTPTPTPTPPSGISLVTTSYSASSAVFPNPERGLHDNVPFPFPSSWNLSDPNLFQWIHDRDSSISVLRGMVRLDAYRGGPIDSGFLNSLNDSFAAIRRNGFKVMLRFMYNYDGGGADAPLNTVLGHISQLSSVLQNNADVIVSMQAGFIGAWGEWHNSQNGLDSAANKQTILNALLGALPSSRMVQIRYPVDTMTMYSQPLTAAQAFSGSNQARVGSHNDCFLNPDNDGGTWDPMNGFSTSQLQAYIQQSSQYTPMSGETCEGFWNSSLGDCITAMATMQNYHWDMLNNVTYDPSSGSWPAGNNPRWVSGGCMDTIKRNLGYRFQLSQSQLPTQIKPGGEFYMTFTVSNVGWGKAFNPRGLEVILRHKASGKVYRLALATDPRSWAPGTTTTVVADGGIPSSAPTGDYDVLLNLPDPMSSLYGNPAYSIQLANQNVWESSTGFNSLLKSVNINTSASGNTYSGSSWFQ